MIKGFLHITVLVLLSFIIKAQQLKPFVENNKWGYKKEQKTIITAQYDTAFIFDKTNQIALVANKNEFNKSVNPLTGEEELEFDYFYINVNNHKIKLLAEHFPDSMFTFPNQQELQNNYQDSSNYFKILFQNKLYLFSKKGKQLSLGFDNITETNAKGYFETETYAEFEKKILRIKGLVDSTGFEVVKCKYNQVSIYKEDSTIYCCSAVYNNKFNDDVFNYKGKLIYTNPNHIAFSSKTMHVMKLYVPKEHFIIENDITKETYTIDGEYFYYLNHNKALLVNKDNWHVFDLKTRKKQKVDKELYFLNLFKIIEL